MICTIMSLFLVGNIISTLTAMIWENIFAFPDQVAGNEIPRLAPMTRITETITSLTRTTINTQSGRSFIYLSLIHISEPTRLGMISYAVFCLKKKKKNKKKKTKTTKPKKKKKKKNKKKKK